MLQNNSIFGFKLLASIQLGFGDVKNNDNLYFAVLGKDVKLSRSSFLNCPNLEFVVFLRDLSSQDQDAFENCEKLRMVYFVHNNEVQEIRPKNLYFGNFNKWKAIDPKEMTDKLHGLRIEFHHEKPFVMDMNKLLGKPFKRMIKAEQNEYLENLRKKKQS